MAWYFIIPLGIVLVVNYILKHSTDDIAHIITAMLVVSLIVSLIIAPWQLQLLLVIVLLLGNLGIWSNHDEIIDGSLEKQPTIELSYRGINYEVPNDNELNMNQPVSNVPVKEETIIGKYRGQLLKIKPLNTSRAQTETQAKFKIKYRGIKIKSNKS